MPLRDMMLDRATKAACDVAFYPSDLYYADLTDDAGADGERKFADWNHRTDGVHGRWISEVHGEGRDAWRGAWRVGEGWADRRGWLRDGGGDRRWVMAGGDGGAGDRGGDQDDWA